MTSHCVVVSHASLATVPCMYYHAINMVCVQCAGNEDGVWDNLREINMYIQGGVNSLSNHISGFPTEPILESFAYANFGGPLMMLLTPTCGRAFGEQAAGDNMSTSHPSTLFPLSFAIVSMSNWDDGFFHCQDSQSPQLE